MYAFCKRFKLRRRIMALPADILEKLTAADDAKGVAVAAVVSHDISVKVVEDAVKEEAAALKAQDDARADLKVKADAAIEALRGYYSV